MSEIEERPSRWQRFLASWRARAANAQRMDEALNGSRAEGHANGNLSKMRHGLPGSGS
ncbi:MAG: hypothetical protein J0I44_01375 [Microbacterium sp.]|uniref:hypothetical protein n=1 Tax=Microbacterium sp. TaxID=51671 RepID=UPI001ACD297C|nr:hypothetical protein [Microbacterium sp.]MBN9155316.1 hypothetical protein [Microbacterium sp.]MBN9168827.1 hypothetical protein [Microbacterium sp.]MBN9178978.1 hypothetical protein [Microbacterium sp.]MBN9189875.1 hypothetical protein [Microbacterium sp.]MBN9192000.1 hypothetical protein [Microbacterium sp.]